MVQSKISLGTAAQQISFVMITNRAAAWQILFGTNTMELHMQYAKKMSKKNGNTYLKESTRLQPKALFIDNR